MTRRDLRTASLALMLALMASACGSSSPSSTTPTTSNGLTTDTLTGTVPVKGSDFKNFTTVATGESDVTLTVAPLPMNLSVGLPGGPGCVPIPGASTLATPGTAAQLAGELTPGTYCVLVADAGSQTAPAAYTVTVIHP